jgi:hypothetical protein
MSAEINGTAFQLLKYHIAAVYPNFGLQVADEYVKDVLFR